MNDGFIEGAGWEAKVDDLWDPLTPPSRTGSRGRRCSHPRDGQVSFYVEHPSGSGKLVRSWKCGACGHLADPSRIATGRRNRSRGNAKERQAVTESGARRTGHFGGADDGLSEDGMFAYQSKSRQTAAWPGWMHRELAKLRAAKPERTPVLVIPESPGPGHRARCLVVVEKADWDALHRGNAA